MRVVCAHPRGGLIDRKGEPTKANSVWALRAARRAAGPAAPREGMIESLLRHAGVPKVAPTEDDVEA